jgi:TetR/AcrR family transcriptional regulator, cholesterol catabolism regulator
MKASAVRRRLDPAKRLELILDEALQLFGTSHFSIVTVRDVAVACGINVGLIYHYFESKDHLVRSVLVYAVGQLIAGYEERRAQHEDDYLSDIGAWLAIHATIAPTTLRMVKIMADYAALEAHDEEIDRLVADFYRFERGLIETALEKGIAAGRYRPVEITRISRLIGLQLDGIFHAAASRGDNRIAEDLADLRMLVSSLVALDASDRNALYLAPGP